MESQGITSTQEIDSDQEAAIFDEDARFSPRTPPADDDDGGDDGEPDAGAAAGTGPASDAGGDGDGELDAGAAPGTGPASDAGGDGDGEPGAGAAPGTGPVAAAALPVVGDFAARRAAVLAQFGERELVAANPETGDEAMSFAALAEEYPAVVNAMLHLLEPYEQTRAYVEAQSARESTDHTLTALDAALPGAREAYEGKDFGPWFEKQPEELRTLAARNYDGALRVMQLFRADHPEAFADSAQAGGKAKGAGLDEATRARRTGALAASTPGASRKDGAGGRQIRTERLSNGMEAIDEEDAQALFDAEDA